MTKKKEKWEIRTYSKNSAVVKEGGPAYCFMLGCSEPMEFSYEETIFAPYRTGVYIWPVWKAEGDLVHFVKPKIIKRKRKPKLSLGLPDNNKYLDFNYASHGYAHVSNPDFKTAGRIAV